MHASINEVLAVSIYRGVRLSKSSKNTIYHGFSEHEQNHTEFNSMLDYKILYTVYHNNYVEHKKM